MGYYRMSLLVLKSLFRAPATRLYPSKARANTKPGTRGSIAIDASRCTLCGSCQRRCPTYAILVERKLARWTINRLRCISCNYCVEVCPPKCLSMLPQYSSPTVTRDRDVFAVPRREKSADKGAPSA
jgi:ech hydrogenase subunit F